MTEEKKRGRPRGKDDLLVATNVRITKETHRELQVAADILGVSQSEIISLGLHALMPNLEEEVQRFEEFRQAARKRAGLILTEHKKLSDSQ